MPLLSSYDPYDQCMYSSTTNRSIYCVAKTKIRPDPTNAVWNYTKVRDFFTNTVLVTFTSFEFQEFSDVKMLHFRHDVLTRGVCIETCLKKLSKGVSPDFDTTDFNDEDVSLVPLFSNVNTEILF